MCITARVAGVGISVGFSDIIPEGRKDGIVILILEATDE